jgi:Ca2+-dependent lipid-binding protein
MVGETEVIDNNLNPVWTKHFDVIYKFNRDSELLFQVWNYNNESSRDLIGETMILLT